ncbi:APC family permease [Arthrobacter sp. GCM10027362]|uniref:APC family permease n=1 Tax=Arthrobacter sp. GCM10027362 TaxID=3273379 RepID=UPI003638DE30
MSLPTATSQQDALSKNSLGVFGVAFLVLAAVAPLTGIVVVTAIGIALGNGGGMVASFIAVTAVLLLFGTGYARMSAELVNAGGFYAFVLRGLGRPAALVTGLVAMIGYNFFVAGAVGTIGFFAQTVIAQLTGLDLHWYLWAIIAVVAAFALSRQGIGFSAKVLGISLVCEVLILLVFDFAVLFTHGFDPAAFNPGIAFSGAVGVGFLFAGNAFVGVEATGLFSEEARDPKRTIPRATFVAIGFIGLFAAFTTWAIVSATGAAQAQDTALGHLEAGDLVFSLSSSYLGSPLTTAMMMLLLVSLFAALMALHNSATRYLYSLSRARILPRSLSRTRANGVPERASIVQFAFATAVAGLFALAGLDPITSLVPSMTGFGTLGIITLQLLAALAIVVHFRRTRDPRLFSTLVAPGIGLLGLAVIVLLAILNFPVLAGSDAPVIAALPLLLLAALAGGLLWAAHLRRNRPEVYEGLNYDLERFEENAPQHVDH